MGKFRLLLTGVFSLIPISVVKIAFLNALGHKISYKARIGYGLLLVKKITAKEGAIIKSFSRIAIDNILLEKNAVLQRFNTIKGPFDLEVMEGASIGRRNSLIRTKGEDKISKSVFRIEYRSNVVSENFFDLTRSITIGENTVIGGVLGSYWTHGFYHADEGDERIRIDGEIVIGDNVYIGSSCLFNPGVRIGNAIHIGAGTVVSKSLLEKGMYVSGPLRHIDNNIETVKEKLDKLDTPDLPIDIYYKSS